ncbi:flagellar transcriptional regulator FlhD [Methylomonas fluvii]|uniref:Flagellar transcriptional regulator FlhD n=1 Tax=Methylomonas fluvii TaxID=1854564 RepID=A0ABR9DJ72_9GAMM|nr:flagellar transcriptional regulator FlhD [Methylomonas fluvii]MBD9362363.1 flagellar transcriptional regulator FlhD [Methylomonas fluvii]CAD6875447.1 hypothetical protein [Methylomonas fluvii]
MDDNLYNLNLDYLITAKELILSGNEQKALFCLGLTPEATTHIRSMSIKQFKQLARSDYLKFAPRFNPNQWEEFLQSVNADDGSAESRASELLMFLPCPNSKS